MFSRIDPPSSVLRLAAGQGGVITAAQARDHGLGRSPIDRLLARGQWLRLTRGVFFVRSDTPPWLSHAWAGVLLGGPGARLGGAAAAHLHGLVPAPDRIEVLCREDSRHRARERWIFVRERDGGRAASVGAPPRLPVEDSVLDLCAGRTAVEVITLIAAAVHDRRTTPHRLRERLDLRVGVSRRLLSSVLADAEVGVESPLEAAYLERVERRHRLPVGRRQHRRGKDRRDVLYEEFSTVVELDGVLGHVGAGVFRDMRRDNRAAVAGEATLRFGWHDVVGQSCQVAEMVAAVLQLRGWAGSMRRCRQCS